MSCKLSVTRFVLIGLSYLRPFLSVTILCSGDHRPPVPLGGGSGAGGSNKKIKVLKLLIFLGEPKGLPLQPKEEERKSIQKEGNFSGGDTTTG